MKIIKNKLNELNQSQKIALLIFGFFCLFIAYCLSSVIITYFYLPGSSNQSGLKYFIKTIPSLVHYFSLKTPYLALTGGAATTAIFSFLSSIVIVCLLMVILFYVAKLAGTKNDMHGSAKWSNEAELKDKKLMGKKGVLVGLYNNKPLYFDSPEFVSLGAPTRSGKGTGIVIPNLMCWEDSLIVLDIKGECFDYTSRYRQDILGQKVYLFNPFVEQTDRYNPLMYLNFDAPTIEIDIQNLANSFYPSDEFFESQARSLFIAITYLFGMLHYNDRLKGNFSLTNISGSLNGIDIKKNHNNFELVELEVIAETVNELGLLPDTIYKIFLSFFAQKTAEKQMAGVKTSFEKGLNAFRNEVIGNSTSFNDFDFRDLRKKKMTIYLVINPHNLLTAKPILNLFFTQLINANIEQGLPDQNPDLKHGVLMLMDEFTSIGQMPVYQLSVSFMAGYWLRSLIIYQNDAQLSEKEPKGYGTNGASTLLENHSCNIIYRPKSPKTAEDISKRIGNITVINKSKSISSKSTSRSESLMSLPLILPQEIMDLKGDEEILLCNGAKLKCKKANYFSTPFIIDKFKKVSPLLKSKDKPNQNDYIQAVQNGELSIPLPSIKSMKKELF